MKDMYWTIVNNKDTRKGYMTKDYRWKVKNEGCV